MAAASIDEISVQLEDIYNSIKKAEINYKKCPKDRLTLGYVKELTGLNVEMLLQDSLLDQSALTARQMLDPMLLFNTPPQMNISQ